MQKPIYLTQPYMQQILKKRILTNCGPFHQQLDQTIGQAATSLEYQFSHSI